MERELRTLLDAYADHPGRNVSGLFAGSTQLPALCRALDWSATALGPSESWPPALRSAIRICLDATIPMAIWAGRDLTLIYNDAYAAILGPHKHPMALGRAARDVWPESWDRYAAELRQVMEFGNSVQHQDERFVLRSEGRAEQAFFSYAFTPIRDEDGDTIAALEILHDTTERLQSAARQSEALARERLMELEALYDTAPIGLCVLDEHLRWVRVNKVIAEINGRSIEDHIGRTPMELVPDVGAQAEEALRTILRTGERLDFEMTGTTAAQPGVERCWSEHWVPIKDPAGRITGISVVAEEITDHKRAARALAESEERFRRLADAMPQLVWTARPDGKIDYYNQRVEELSGMARQDDGTFSWEGAVHAEDLGPTLAAWERALRDAGTYEVTHRLTRADGATHWYLTRAIPVHDADGRVVHWFGTTTDIDLQKRTEEALREADRHKNEFLAMLSHDLRNPFSVIRTSLALLEQAGADSPHGKRALAVLGRQVNQMGRLLDDLLDVTRISKGKLLLQREPLELNAIVRAIGEDHAELFERERIDFRVIVPASPLCARGDRARLTQAIGNLLQNAAKFTSEGGLVTLSLRTTDGADALIEVSDNGAGIQPELLDRLFDPLVQAHRTLHQSRGGLGLGLAVVKGIVELHGGSVSASSEGPGRGAVFTIQVPLELEAYESSAT